MYFINNSWIRHGVLSTIVGSKKSIIKIDGVNRSMLNKR